MRFDLRLRFKAKTVIELLRTHVQQPNPGQLGAAGPGRQHHTMELPGVDQVQRFQAGRGRPQEYRYIALPGPPDRDGARRVPAPVLLLEAAVVFFVDDDEAEPRYRHEHP